MSRAQHEHEVNERLTRRRTQARIQSESAGRSGRQAHPRTASTPNMPLPYPNGQRPTAKPSDFQRRNTIRIAEQVANTGWDRSANRPSPTPQHSATMPANGADGRQRYSLTDRPASGIGLGPAPLPAQHSSTLPPSGAPSAGRPSSAVAVGPPKKGPSTFAEMGVPEAKLKKVRRSRSAAGSLGRMIVSFSDMRVLGGRSLLIRAAASLISVPSGHRAHDL